MARLHFSPQSDPVVSLLFTDQPRHCGLLSHPVQFIHAGESAARRPGPQPAACGPTRPAERPLLPGESHTALLLGNKTTTITPLLFYSLPQNIISY